MMMSAKVFLIAVCALSASLLLCIVGIVVLALADQAVPDVLQNIAVGSLTGLVGLLVQKRDDPDEI